MKKSLYFDYAASTPVDRRVERAMTPYFGRVFGNPHALHGFGQAASAAVFEARRTIARALGADYREIIFTGSATEANNLAIRGAIKAYRESHKGVPKIITTAIEHESVLETCRDLEKDGVEVAYLPVSTDGLVDLKKLEMALDDRTVLVSVMHANNEVGTIQPISEIAKIIKEFRSHPERQRRISRDSSARPPEADKPQNDNAAYPLFHTDAAQSFQYLDCRADSLGADLITLSAHKIYGPKGIGALYIRPTSPISPMITGSGQESGLRSGTDNVPYIVGFAKAVEIADKIRKKEAARIGKLRDYFWQEQQKIKVVPRLRSGTKKKLIAEPVEALQLNGSLENRLPNNLNIYFPGRKAHDLQIELDLAGIAASPGAACRSAVAKASYVIAEMGFPMERAEGSLRFTLGRQTTKAEIDYAVKIMYNLLN